MYFKATDGIQFLQFHSEDEKEAKKRLKEYGSSFRLLKDDFDYHKIFTTVSNYIRNLNTAKKQLSLELASSQEEQEAKDYMLSKNKLLCPVLLTKYKEKDLDTKCEEILLALAHRIKNISVEIEKVDAKLSILNELKNKILSEPEECIKSLETFKE